ncbi:hypothetical protein NDU88_001467 [Pleurodeles waltl]|uniref:Uncharacterized protein n=1 Tax=Pleurodeles waltl TaxID=8319 RepID=A0AAV7V9U2_PLEWA|nr:hypothetical protein NDU88_001467 [Pleurodeles waltl]
MRLPPNDRSGHSNFPAGPAGDCQKAVRWPSGKAPATRMPARNGADGVAGVRRVQWHPSRFSLSAKQTVKIFVGPPGAPRHPFPPSSTARNRLAGRGSESPWRCCKQCRHGGFPGPGENRRKTADSPFLTAALPLRSE